MFALVCFLKAFMASQLERLLPVYYFMQIVMDGVKPGKYLRSSTYEDKNAQKKEFFMEPTELLITIKLIFFWSNYVLRRGLLLVEWKNQFRKSDDGCGNLNLDDFKSIKTLGEGAFAKVYLVKNGQNGKTFAAKVLKKTNFLDERQRNRIVSEKDIQLSCRNDFIVRLFRSFRDARNIYLLMEYVDGGELWSQIQEKGRFDESTAKYYTAAAIEALEYLHERNIVYRDLKPENMLITRSGLPKLTDFGFAKCLDNRDGDQCRTFTFCGTPEYVAPEMILNVGHDTGVDVWALGIFIYELVTGRPPFCNMNTKVTYDAILRGFERRVWPGYFPRRAVNLIKALCKKDAEKRLGYRNLNQIRENDWFSNFDFNAFRNFEIEPPIVPTEQSMQSISDEEPLEIGNDNEVNLDDWDSQF